jgi:hypothetical protein
MAASSAVLANRALRHLGVRGRITDLSTDVTAEGVALNELYLPVVIRTLKIVPWRFARKVAALTLVETFTGGTTASDQPEWNYSYRLPEDCLQPLRVHYAGVRNPFPVVPYTIKADTDSTTYDAATTYAAGDYVLSASIWYRALRETIGDTPASSTSDWVAVDTVPPLLFTDVQDAVLEYTFDLSDDPTRFTDEFEDAVGSRLAYEVAPSVTVNGSADMLMAATAALHNEIVTRAMKNDWDEAGQDQPPYSLYQSVRGTGRRV